MAIDQLGTGAAETMVVGDSYDRDVVPAKTLGCTTVWLRGRSPTDPADTSKADYVIHSFEAVRSFLRTTRDAVPR
jgi:putative hydrolase of the HAD superfamily